MTYLDLMNRVKDGTQPIVVEYKGELYKWTGANYRHGINYLNDSLDEVHFGTRNCIKGLMYEQEAEPDDQVQGSN